jgi:hypothetical protein
MSRSNFDNGRQFLKTKFSSFGNFVKGPCLDDTAKNKKNRH